MSQHKTNIANLLREIVAYCREAGHDWSNLAEAEAALASAQAQQSERRTVKVRVAQDPLTGEFLAMDAPSQAQQAGEVVRAAIEFYANGDHIVDLHGQIDWTTERDRMRERGFSMVCEGYNGIEVFVEDGRMAQAALAHINATPTPPAQQGEPT